MKELVAFILLTSAPVNDKAQDDPCDFFRQQGYECSVVDSGEGATPKPVEQCGTTHGVWQCWA